MLDDDANCLDEGFIGASASHKTVDMCINFCEHEDSKSWDVVPRVARGVGKAG